MLTPGTSSILTNHFFPQQHRLNANIFSGDTYHQSKNVKSMNRYTHNTLGSDKPHWIHTDKTHINVTFMNCFTSPASNWCMSQLKWNLKSCIYRHDIWIYYTYNKFKYVSWQFLDAYWWQKKRENENTQKHKGSNLRSLQCESARLSPPLPGPIIWHPTLRSQMKNFKGYEQDPLDDRLRNKYLHFVFSFHWAPFHWNAWHKSQALSLCVIIIWKVNATHYWIQV
jgi:hypothetical protein